MKTKWRKKYTPRRKTFKKRSFKRRTLRKGGKKILRKPTNVGTGAFTVETIAFNDLGVNSGAPYTFAFNIGQFNRAAGLQPQFKYYRAAKVTWTYEANYNSYTPSANGGSSVAAGPTCPQLYWRMDRLGQNAFQSVSEFQDAGAKPIPMSRKKVISYIPSTRVLWPTPYSASGTPAGPYEAGMVKPVRSQWLATNSYVAPDGSDLEANALPAHSEYYGHQAIIDQVIAGGLPSENLVRCVCTVHWQFKDPYIVSDASPQQRVSTVVQPKPTT